MKIAVLHTRLSNYIAACLRELQRQANAEILMYVWPNQPDAPFDISTFADLGKLINRYEHNNKAILNQVMAFGPSAVLVSGWRDKGYIRICRALKAKGIPVVAGCDTQWKGSLRQYLASWVAPLYIQQFIDVLWVTGERQRYLAQALGYTGIRCWDGYYACDWQAFANEEHSRTCSTPSFLYVGRYVPEKGIQTLAEAYQVYRQQKEKPWPLICIGSGPLKHTLLEAGAQDYGFVQPNNLPVLMRQASAFVLPSKFEPWGVVAQEAAASSLPLILSDACGSSVHLLKPYLNGFSFRAGSVFELTQSLKAMHELDLEQRLAYGRISYLLSKQYTPQRWAKTLRMNLSVLAQRN